MSQTKKGTNFYLCKKVVVIIMYTNEEILRIAMEQSALDNNCRAEDFLMTKNVITESIIGPKARKYFTEPVACNFVSYGNNIVASVKNEFRAIAAEYISRFTYYHCFETPNLHWLDQKMEAKGQKVCFMAEYFLPDVRKIKRLPCQYPMKILYQNDFADLYVPEWGNALCRDRKELDVLGVGAYDGSRLIGLAGCSADCERMWQIGIDVLPEYRRQGIAAALTSNLAMEVLERELVPFYCCAWSNVRSSKNAVASGFTPSWVEMTVKPTEMVEKMNQG